MEAVCAVGPGALELHQNASVAGETEAVLLELSLFRFWPGAPQLDDVVAYMKEHGFVVERVAVVAGGAAFPALMQEALDAGCDTYVTGDFRVRHGGPWAEEHRPDFDAFVAQVPLNLVGGSHAGTEGLVLKRDMIEWFAKLGLPAEFVPQADLWR